MKFSSSHCYEMLLILLPLCLTDDVAGFAMAPSAKGRRSSGLPMVASHQSPQTIRQGWLPFTTTQRMFYNPLTTTTTTGYTNDLCMNCPSLPPSSSSSPAQKQQRKHNKQPHQDEPFGANNRHSASDWMYNVRSVTQSKVLREIRGPVLAVAGWSFVVSVLHRVLGKAALAQRMFGVPATAHSFLVSAISLLLVFRTNSAYQRFYEGRKIWENILSISRSLTRMIRLYGKEVGADRKRRIFNLLAAYPYLLRHHIRSGCLCEERDSVAKLPLEDLLLLRDEKCGGMAGPISEGNCGSAFGQCWVNRRKLPWNLLDRKSQDRIAIKDNRPLWICDRMGKEIMSVPYTPNYTSRERLALLGQVDKLTKALGECERIHQTAVPLNYARHALRSLTLWLFTLPFVMVKDFGFLTAPVTAAVAWLLFGVYQIGYSIEDPFQGSLRLSSLCESIRHDVLDTSYDDDDDDDLEENEENEADDINLNCDFSQPGASRPPTASPEEMIRLTTQAEENPNWLLEERMAWR